MINESGEELEGRCKEAVEEGRPFPFAWPSEAEALKWSHAHAMMTKSGFPLWGSTLDQNCGLLVIVGVVGDFWCGLSSTGQAVFVFVLA